VAVIGFASVDGVLTSYRDVTDDRQAALGPASAMIVVAPYGVPHHGHHQSPL
jgi:hypothetical protein